MGRNTVRVVVRTRPTENFAKGLIGVADDNRTINIHTPKRTSADGRVDVINNALEDVQFKTDLVMRDASQETVFDTCASDIIKAVMQGYNGTVMCYGQTGAGKTYTMMGGTDYRTRGITPRAIKAVYEEIASHADKTFKVRVSFVEVYQERIHDLINPGSNEDIAIQEDAKGNIAVRGVEHKLCNQEAEALAYLFEGNTNRAVAGHTLNPSSSRSHVLYTLHITSRSRVESESASLVSKLHCIDLAGSERLSKTESQGQVMKEAQFINKSLTFLEQVVMALGSSNRAHVPFRQSKLTNLLKDSLGGNSRTTMIANIWPEAGNMEETMSTLRFAMRMMKVHTDATVNVVLDPATQLRQLQRQIAELKAELQMQNQLMGKSHIVYEGEVGEDERFEMEKVVKAYVAGQAPEIPVRSLREVKEYFRIFKAFTDAREAEVVARVTADPAAFAAVGAVAVVDPKTGKPVPGQPQPPAAAAATAATAAPAAGSGVGAIDNAAGFSVGVGAPAKGLREMQKAGVVSPSKADADTSPRDASNGGAASPAPPGKAGSAGSRSGPGVRGGGAGGGGGAGAGGEAPRELPDKSQAFADFKASDGARLHNTVKDLTATLAARRRVAADLALRINAVKADVDSVTFQLEQRRLDRQARGEDETVDDEEFDIVRVAKAKKSEYRQLYDELITVKAERDQAAKGLDMIRQRLLTEFEAWYAATYGEPTKQARLAAGLKAARSVRGAAVADDDDQLDEGEKFEILELNRVMEDDPDSVAYYSARKAMQAKQQIRKAGPFNASVPRKR